MVRKEKALWVSPELHNDVMLFKVACKVKSAEEVIRKAIILLQEKLNEIKEEEEDEGEGNQF